MRGKKILSRTWGDKAKKRFMRQHGTLDVHDLPQTDAHAIREYSSPVQLPPPTPEEQLEAEELLEAQIRKLKAAPQPDLPPPPPPPAPKLQPKPQPVPKPPLPQAPKLPPATGPKSKEPEKHLKNSAGSFYDEWID